MNTMKTTRAQLRLELRFEQATRKQIEQGIAKLAITGGPAAIENQVRLLGRIRKELAGKPGMADFVDDLDWGLECLYRQHYQFTKNLGEFINGICE